MNPPDTRRATLNATQPMGKSGASRAGSVHAEGRLSYFPPLRGIAVALVGMLAACQTPHQFADDRSAKWTMQTGQLKYTSGERVLVGEVVVSQRGASDFQIEFQKGGGLPLLKLRMDATTARAEGIFARGSWQGAPDRAPKALRGWVGLREAFAKRQPDRFTVALPNSEDRFEFIFE